VDPYHPVLAPINVAPVLPSPPPRTDGARFTPSDDVIDLRSVPTETWAEETSGWEPAGASPSDLASVSDLASEPVAQPSAGLTGEPVDRQAPGDADPHTGISLRSASVGALVERARDGHAGAWEELVSRFGGMIIATGRRYRLTSADVAELQQTTWLRLVENLHRIEQPERVGGWLATTARRESLQLLRRAAKYHAGADQMLANMPDKHLPEPDARPIAEERDVVLRAAWGRLKPRCQQLLSLLMTDDPLGYKDLSKLLVMPVGSIGPTRARCLEHLRRLVEEEGLSAI
jgi:RNA polymerase sigma factor (sigma-70 family)